MPRVVSIWLPQLPIERLRAIARGTPARANMADGSAAPELRQPLALVEGGAKGLRITAVNEAAAAVGVAPGQSLADARAALPALRTRPAEPARDAATLLDLARWAGRYGPARNVDGGDGLWVDIAGVDHLYGGEARLLDDCRRRLTTAGFSVRLGLADTAAAAWALARFGNAPAGPAIAPPDATRAMLAALPVEALRLTPQSVLLLRRLGLYRIGQLYPLPRASLAQRFRDCHGRARGSASAAAGLADAVVLRLDQALGMIREPRRPLAALPDRLVRQVFAEPLIAAAGLETAIATAIEQLCGLLSDAGEGVRRLRLCLYRTDGTSAGVDIGTSSPSRDSRHLGRLLAEKLTTLDLGFGVDVVTLEAAAVEPLGATQVGLGARPRRAGAQGVAQLLDRLANRAGDIVIYRLAARQSHIPEQAQRAVPALTAATGVAVPLPGCLPPRPPFLLTPPEPIVVVAEVPEGPPRRFQWRRALHRVLRAEGPERIEPAWWQAIGAEQSSDAMRPRDYYRVEDDRGGRYWVFREGRYDRDSEAGPPVWYVHGLFG
jgi:protein ImuB